MIRNIWAVGRNYGDHAKELGNAVPEKSSDPMIFLKAGSSIVENEGTIHLPKFSSDTHHECEIAFQFGRDFSFDKLTVAIDVTARDTQAALKAAGHPWTLAKSFKDSAAIGPLVAIPSGFAPDKIRFSLEVNGEKRQAGTTSDMIHNVEKLRLFILERFPVCPGDLVFTGTPKGVAQMKSGDRMNAEIEGLVKASWTVRLS